MPDYKAVLKDLDDAMGALYQARHKVTGPEGPVEGQYYPEMDREAFDQIAHLQTMLQKTISETKGKIRDDRPDENNGL